MLIPPFIPCKSRILQKLRYFWKIGRTHIAFDLVISLVMKADWIETKRGDLQPQYAGLRASMNPRGDIVINRAAHEMLGGPKAFLILYDRINQRIGLRPAALTTRNAYPALASNRTGAKMVRGHRMTREQRINLAHTVQFDDAEIDEDGILILDLRTAVVSRRALASNKRSADSARQSAKAEC